MRSFTHTLLATTRVFVPKAIFIQLSDGCGHDNPSSEYCILYSQWTESQNTLTKQYESAIELRYRYWATKFGRADLADMW